MFSVRTETTGLAGLAESLLAETRDDLRPVVDSGGRKLEERARQKLSHRGGPSRPGDPPARETGALGDSIGRSEVRTASGEIEIEWGVGAGPSALARMRNWISRGVDVPAYAKLHEEGGVGAGGRRYPARSYLRSTELELEPAIDADLERAL